jgi:hypothetical protein
MPDKRSATPLTDFLMSLSSDQALTSYNARSRESADAFLQDQGLNADQRAAILSRDVTAIAYQLSLETQVREFFIPCGPVMDAPARFKVTLEGVMDPGPFPGVMDPFPAARKPSGGGKRPTKGRPAPKKKPRPAKKASKSRAKKVSKAGRKRRK